MLQRLHELGHVTKEVEEIADVVERQTVSLAKEVAKFCQERGVTDG